MKSNYKYLDHTADILFEARAPTVEQLFEQCALAVEEAMVELKTVGKSKKQSIKAEGSTLEKLLFDFLNELVYLKDAEQFLGRNFDVSVVQTEVGYILKCNASGEKINTQKHHLKVDVKAITLHLFTVEKIKDGWKATVLMDI